MYNAIIGTDFFLEAYMIFYSCYTLVTLQISDNSSLITYILLHSHAKYYLHFCNYSTDYYIVYFYIFMHCIPNLITTGAVSRENRSQDFCHCYTKRGLGWQQPSKAFFGYDIDYTTNPHEYLASNGRASCLPSAWWATAKGPPSDCRVKSLAWPLLAEHSWGLVVYRMVSS